MSNYDYDNQPVTRRELRLELERMEAAKHHRRSRMFDRIYFRILFTVYGIMILLEILMVFIPIK